MTATGAEQPTLPTLLWRRVGEAPSQDFVITPEQAWTYRDLAGRASALADRLDGAPLVACMLRNGASLVATMFGAWTGGSCVALLNHGISGDERVQALDDVGAKVLVTERALVARWGAPEGVHVLVAEDLPELTAAWRGGPVGEPVAVDPDADAAVIFTSGTTGKPKGAALTHRGLIEGNLTLAEALRRRPGPYPVAKEGTPPNLVALPLAHTGGLSTLVFALLVGRSIVVVEKFRPELVAELAPRFRFDSLVCTPTMLHMLAAAREDIDLSSVRFALSGGAPLDANVKAAFEQRFGVPIIEDYGQTETGQIAGWAPDDLANGAWKAGSVGKPFPGVELVISDEENRPVGPGEVGEIRVRTRHRMRAYVGDPPGNGDEASDGWVATGDMGYLDADGYLFLVGRKRELIICGGFNVYPAEVERVLLSHPGVRDAVVFGVRCERLGEIPVAAVVPATGELSEAEILEHCRSRIAHYKAVREVRFFPELPLTESNKIRRSEIASLWLGGRRSGE